MSSANGQPEVLRTICFDLGGVILRICRSWEEGCKAAGIEVRGLADRDRTAAARREAIVAYQCGQIECTAFAHRIAELLDHLYSPQEIMAVHTAWVLGEYPGVAGLIEEVHAAGLHTACLSNTNHAHWVQLHVSPAVMLLHTRLASHELGLHKPDPAIYRAAERRLNAQPSEIIFFDDLPENVEAARECSWDAVQVDHAGDPAAQMRAALIERGVLRA